MTNGSIINKQIAIIGGGPGGLTLARLLQISGAHVKVYERDLNKDARVQGATLDLHEESGLEALRKGGLMEAFLANYRPGAEKVRILDKNATIIADDHLNTSVENLRPEIDRGPLRKILLESLHADTVVWNSQFVSLQQTGDTWNIRFRDGSSACADIVIAADGAGSRVRPYLTTIQPFYAGVTAVEGNVYDSENASPRMHKLLKGGKIFAFGDDKALIVSAKGDGSLAFYTSCETEEDWILTSGIDFSDPAQVLAWFKRDFAEWDDVWHELFEAASSFIPRPQYCMPLDQTWEPQPGLTMLGDAAHLMPPYAGEGVNMAMLDALELSICFTSNEFPDTLSAITAYEQRMRARAAETARITLESMEMLHSAEAISFISELAG